MRLADGIGVCNQMVYALRLYKDEIAPGTVVSVTRNAAIVSATYIVSGSLRLRSESFSGALGANSAFCVMASSEIVGGSLPAFALRWELCGNAAAPPVQLARGVSTTLLMSVPVSLEHGQSYLLRCDRVDFPPTGVAFLHTHQGGGIRCLLAGSIEIETQGTRHRYGPLEPWFEAGPDPVFAAASASEATAFVRLMILPRTLLGKSSISYVNAADLDKPKSQSYQVFIDTPIELPR